MTTPPLADRIALVTGASRGIGRAAALALGRAGAHMIIAARRTSLLETLDDEIRSAGGTATLLELDLTKTDKVDAIGPSIYQRWGRLDILVGNAGILGPLSPLSHVSKDAWEQVLAVNLTANWHLIRTCDPLLRKSGAGRAVFLTCVAAQARTAYWGPIAVAKAGLEALVKTYARECANTAVRVNLLDPGPMRTEFRQRAFPGENPEALPEPAVLGPLIVRLASPDLTENGELFAYAGAG